MVKGRHFVLHFLRNRLLILSEVERPEQLTEKIMPVVNAAWEGWRLLTPDIFGCNPASNVTKGAGLTLNFLIPSILSYHTKRQPKPTFDLTAEGFQELWSSCHDLADANFWHSAKSSPDGIPGESRNIGGSETDRVKRAFEFYRCLYDPETKVRLDVRHTVSPLQNIWKLIQRERELKKAARKSR